ncbi:MAG: signal recognition particle-docking protein FtsY [Candidatus Woesearchaeota archaeon]
MFKFLKEKLSKAVENISNKIETEGKEEVKTKEEVIREASKEKKGFFKRLFGGKKEDVKKESKKVEEIKEVEEIVDGKKPIVEAEEKKPVEEVKEVEEIVQKIGPVVEKKREIAKVKEIKKEKPQVKEVKREVEEIKPIQQVYTEEVEIKKAEPKKEEAMSVVDEFKVEEFLEEIKKEKPAEIKEKRREEKKEETKKEETKEEKSFFAKIKEKITTTKISEKQFNELFWEIELGLLENNVAVEVIEKIKHDLRATLVEKPIPRGKVKETIVVTLKDSIDELFNVGRINLLDRINHKKPFVICFVGINGSGKTTTIAKLAHWLQQHRRSCVIAAGDTFRAAAIQQLEEHANKLGVKLIKHDYGADPAAVGFDAIKYAQAHKIDVVLIDTAGRLHSNTNLVDEMKKIVKVTKPDLKIFVGESITGNDCVEQAQKFNQAIELDGIILSKADVDEKGGAAISVSYVTKKPIIYIGTGQNYSDLKEFDKKIVLDSLGLSS